ncbi:type IX secretion system outer membrane channel protein PorV [Parabacteroides sp. OttesenSCG-928-G07]|nr:type IX secretion system outer membrane channel protein PorV [Parabacteroides sp. OttesenSCG-928-G07]
MMNSSKVKLLLTVFCLIISMPSLLADDPDIKKQFAPINTAVPSLSIAPDARGGAMGDNGVSTTPDISSQYWNPAKYAFQYSQAGVSLSYTPWLRKLVNDVAMVYLSGFYKLGDADNQALGASVRYFTLGELVDRQEGQAPLVMNPYEMAVDLSYSRKLSESFSMGVALRYIRSDMGSSSDDRMVPDDAFAADVSGYAEKYVILGNNECLWSFGFNVSNIGTKVSYDGNETNQFLPTTLKLGTGLLFPLDDYNRLGLYLDASKYLVPSVPVQNGNTTEDIDDYNKRLKEYNDMSPIKGMFKSFGDSPRGFKGEMQEVMLSLGAEYSYNDQFFVRGGYYYENENMGNRQYFSLGAGFKMSVFQLDAAYLISTVQSNPLDQTLRFSLSFDMDGLRSLVR